MFVLTTRALIWMNICVGFVLCSPNLVSGSNPSVTKIVIRYIAPDLPGDASGAKPKTMYLADRRYARIEEERDSSAKGVLIVNQPDIWVIDLQNNQGTHTVNLGPDLTIHNPILGPECPDELFDFEFGREAEFLKRIGAKSLASKEIGERKCETWEFEVGHYLVVVYIDTKKKCPIALKAFAEGKMKFTIEYLRYETDLPFDSSLFKPPNDIRISEATQ